MPTVDEVYPPRCGRCEFQLTTTAELRRRTDWAVDLCDACVVAEDEDDAVFGRGEP